MLKKLKKKLKSLNNHGSSFVLVIVSATFLSILVSALLMGTLLAYKLRFYKLNSLNNFYSVEKAMDEIYAGIGAITNEHLYSAYTTTAETAVYYDTATGQYKTLQDISDTTANEMFQNLFMQNLSEDQTFSDMSTLVSKLKGFITDDNVELVCDNLRVEYKYKDKSGNGTDTFYIQYKTNKNGKVINVKSKNIDLKSITVEEITLKNIGVQRTITLSGGSASESMAPRYLCADDHHGPCASKADL